MRKHVRLSVLILAVVLSVSCDYINDLGIEAGLNEGLVAYWPVMESGTTTVKDYSGNNRNLILNNLTTITYTTGQFGNALYYHGNPTSTSVYSGSIFNAKNSFTISMWINLQVDNENGRVIIIGGTDYPPTLTCSQGVGSNIPVGLSLNDGSNTASVNNNTNSSGTWTYITFVFTGNDLSMYVNGSLVKTATATLTLPDIDQFQIGGTISESTPVNGYLDEIRIYNRALSQDEIKKLMDVGRD